MINLTLNKETRSVEAKPGVKGHLMVYGVKMVTTSGNKTHTGWIMVKEGKEDYTVKDIVDLGYHGMRGNGSARPSQMRYIGF